jgi:CRP-like cAMP-binding protein
MSNLASDCFQESFGLFFDIPISIQTEIMAISYTRSFARGEALFFTGNRIAEVLLLVEGCVKITQLTEQGNEVILRLRKPGELIGMPEWEPEGIHSSTAQALLPCNVIAWDAQKFESVKRRVPQLQRNANEIIARTLDKLERRYFEVLTGKVAYRLAHGLVHVLEEIGRRVNDYVEISLSREELGQMTAVSPSEVSRALGQWERQGLVRLGRGVIEVRSVARLLSLCETRCFGLTAKPVSHLAQNPQCNP